MKKSILNIEKLHNKKDFIKALGFISESITSIKTKDNCLSITIEDNCDKEGILEKINDLYNRYLDIREDEILETDSNKRSYFTKVSSAIKNLAPGMIELQGKSVFLFRYFESVFERIATNLGAEIKIYPVLLPISSYIKTGYLKNSPQYAYFCYGVEENLENLEKLNNKLIKNISINNNLQKMQFALSPSACFHTYLDYQEQILDSEKIITFTQNVFRNEGRFNFSERGRFRDYHVREIVFMGSSNFVNATRSKIIEKTIEFVKSIGFDYCLVTASDSFIIPKLQKYKNIQKLEKTKYELRLNIDPENDISVASFNIHGTAFTEPFNISVKDVEKTVTGCVGYGIERWVYAFLSQFGDDEKNWPKKIYDVYKNNNGELLWTSK